MNPLFPLEISVRTFYKLNFIILLLLSITACNDGPLISSVLDSEDDDNGGSSSTGFGNSNPQPGPPIGGGGGDCFSDTDAELLNAFNEERAKGNTCGETYFAPVAALTWNCELGQAATAHSQDMANNNYFSHTSLDGRSFSERIRATGYTGSPRSEIIAAGQRDVQSVVNSWMNSPGHCSAIMSGSSNEVGAGVVDASGATYSKYWTANFGFRQ